MSDYINLTVTILPLQTTQRLRVQRDVTTGELLSSFYNEFAGELEMSRPFYLWEKDGRGALKPSFRFGQLRSGTALFIGYEDAIPSPEYVPFRREQLARIRATEMTDTMHVFLHEPQTDSRYPLNWTFAILGREGHTDYENADRIALREETYQAAGLQIRSISREQAAIVYYNDQYYIVSLQKKSPVYINDSDRALPLEEGFPLQADDRIQLGRKKFELIFHQPVT